MGHLNKISTINLVGWLKNGSFAFAEGLACELGAKANVLFVRWGKN
mgnify:CR=1 FL=1